MKPTKKFEGKRTLISFVSLIVLGVTLIGVGTKTSSPTISEETVKLNEAYSGPKVIETSQHPVDVVNEDDDIIFITEPSTTRVVTTTQIVEESTEAEAEVEETTEKVEETTEVEVEEIEAEAETEDDESEEEVEADTGAPSEYQKKITDMHFTGYCLCKKCCGKSKSHPDWGVCKNGYEITPDIGEKVVAVDPDEVPLGSIVYVDCPGDIPDYGYAYACDTGSAINGKDVDLYIDQESGPWYDSKYDTTVYIVETGVSHEEWRNSDLNVCKGFQILVRSLADLHRIMEVFQCEIVLHPNSVEIYDDWRE
jgi:3D (Asp-Asp-Asp) domain-containing protein